MIISRTPFRVSFFGGGTDYPAWFTRHGGAVLATTIDKYCYITCRHLPPFFDHRFRVVYSRIENTQAVAEIQHPAVRAVLQHVRCADGLEIHHDGDVPARSGLGSSSSFTVGLYHAVTALNGRHVSREELAAEAIHIEQEIIRENVGSQDQICAAFGGFNHIEFLPDRTFRVSPMVLPRARLEELQDCLILLFTGLPRTASDVAAEQLRNLDKRTRELESMGALVGEAIDILRDPRRPLAEFGALLDRGWQLKRSLSERVSTPEIDECYDAAKRAGALGGKILGAGGGGFLLLFAEPGARAGVIERLKHLIHVPFRFESTGSRIVLYQPQGLA